jgi:sugar phosphate isomerase/epimerase
MTKTELCWGTVQHAPMATLARVAADNDFESFTVTPAMGYAVLQDPALLREITTFVRSAGLRVGCLDALMKGLPGAPAIDTLRHDMRQHFTHDADECFRVAEALGIRLLNITHYLGAPVPRAALVDAIGDVAQQAQARGITTCLEFMPGTGIPNLGAAVEIMTAVGSNVGVLVDTWHFARTGGTVEQLQRLAAGAVVSVQVNDRIGRLDRPVASPDGPRFTPMANRLLPGEGELPLAEIVRALIENNPAVPIGIEVFSDEMRSLTPFDAAARAAESLSLFHL